MNLDNSKIYEGVGLMSGTSMDGIDLAYCRFVETNDHHSEWVAPIQRWSYEIRKSTTHPMPSEWYKRLSELGNQDAVTYAKTHVEFGHFLGKMMQDFLEREGLEPQFIASHGQTIFHQPEQQFTAQIGDGESMAAYLKVPLVTQFRNKDLALGGEGAPLVPMGEKCLFPSHTLFLNLGGIANLTLNDVAFDVCVCNLALNWLANRLIPGKPFDAGGEEAASGKVYSALLHTLNELAWYRLPPPKSLGKEWFEESVIPVLEAYEIPVCDKLATYTEHIAEMIVSELGSKMGSSAQGYPQDHGKGLESPNQTTQLLVTGGGVHHVYLMERLQKLLGDAGIPISISTNAELCDSKEAMIFAFLGLQVLLGRPNTLHSMTGASMDCIGGSIHLPPRVENFQLPLKPLDSSS